jgi:predicted nucleic acid-binding Zn ribbon protein
MSRRREEDKWGPHSHCIVCGNAIPEGEKTCSEECAKKYDNEANRYKRQKKMNYLFIAGMGGIIVLFFLISYLRSGG